MPAKIYPFAHGHSQDWHDAVVIKPEYSPINLLGKVIYRHQPPWEQRSKAILLLWSVTTGLILGGCCVALILLQNGRH